jgi:hypothetical protein
MRKDSNTYCWELDGEVREENLLRALPLLSSGRDLGRLQLPLAEVRDGVDDDPWYTAAEVHQLGLPVRGHGELAQVGTNVPREAGSWQGR